MQWRGRYAAASFSFSEAGLDGCFSSDEPNSLRSPRRSSVVLPVRLKDLAVPPLAVPETQLVFEIV